MHNRNLTFRSLLLLVLISLSISGAFGQKKSGKKKHGRKPQPVGKPVIWQAVNIERRNLFDGPGGADMKPDLSKIEFIEREKGGHNKKYRIRDGSGRIWVAKPYTEARPETAATRILWALGYPSEINYLVPVITIPTVGKLTNVRLEARPDNIERLGRWSWKKNPFLGTDPFQGLKLMQIFLKNNDVIDVNNKIFGIDSPDGRLLEYVISDLGSTFGKSGNNDLPLFYRLGRKNDSPAKWDRAGFINGVKKGRLKLSTKGIKGRSLYRDITIAQARWLAGLLGRLSERQLRDAFRAANYSPAEIELLLHGFKRRINELNRVVNRDRLAKK